MNSNQIIQSFTVDLGMALGFLIGALLVNITLGTKVLYWYLILVLLSMLVMNGETLKNFLGKVNK